MNSNFNEQQIKAALRAAFNLEFQIVEAHTFMCCDWFFWLKSPLKVIPLKGDNFTTGAIYSVNIFNRHFNTFCHYSNFGYMEKMPYGLVDYFEIEVASKKSLKISTFVYGRRFSKYIPIGLS